MANLSVERTILAAYRIVTLLLRGGAERNFVEAYGLIRTRNSEGDD